jgi:hypothetical protein
MLLHVYWSRLFSRTSWIDNDWSRKRCGLFSCRIERISGRSRFSTVKSISKTVSLALGALVPTIIYGFLIFGNKIDLGSFVEQDKIEINEELAFVCKQTQETTICSDTNWHGKHRWFGSVNLLSKEGGVSQDNLTEHLIAKGWRVKKDAAAYPKVYLKRGLSLAYAYDVPRINRFTISRNLELE